ncbi:MAG: preprotein translocase subunit SecA [Proteobacteria bacterium]|nr:preprotein translocase subunit SecA [Pseudomonadota bacterium]
MAFMQRLFGTQNDRILKKKISPLVKNIEALEPTISALSDEELQAKTPYFKELLRNGKSLDDLLCEVFAVCREASKRVLSQRHFPVQLAGGIVLHYGNIAEMKTGEGKTLTATLPCYLRGLTGKGAHVVTVNEYLAQRDAKWMGATYTFLGLSVGVIVQGLSYAERKKAYAADITYGTNNEFGFDYLRDNMKVDVDHLVQRPFHFAIVDEVDSILIDEARTPLIISGDAEGEQDSYHLARRTITGLRKDSDYVIDEKSRSVSLTDDGVSRIEKRLKIANMFDLSHAHLLHHIHQALKAEVLFKKDVHYVVQQNRVMIIDEHTGRLMPGRRYGDGLHSALEAKESVEVQKETQTLASITFQNFFRMYPTLSGMTGTADTEAVEFKKIYNLDVVVIPTNKPIIRQDMVDVVYRTASEKFEAIAAQIAKESHRGQPVLVGTTSVEKSELLSSLLKDKGTPHEILNAKNHSREADIIAHAGERGHVTIATNMAGRGTDIQLSDETLALGGLLVIGTERHESRRIDNQLRGRSGRQGDPGKSSFYLSLEDDLMRIFASDRLSGIMKTMGLTGGAAIESSMVSRAIEKAQKRVEEQNFSSRKHLLEYDDVMNTQRTIIYQRRGEALRGEMDFAEVMFDAVDRMAAELLEDAAMVKELQAMDKDTHDSSLVPKQLKDDQEERDSWPLAKMREKAQELFHYVPVILGSKDDVSRSAPLPQDEESFLDILKQDLHKKCDDVLDVLKEFKEIHSLSQSVYLQIVDVKWKSHLLDMDGLKDAVRLRGYGQRDPLQEYKKEAYQLFSRLMDTINREISRFLLSVPPRQEIVRAKEAALQEQQQQQGEQEQQEQQQDTAEVSPTTQALLSDALNTLPKKARKILNKKTADLDLDKRVSYHGAGGGDNSDGRRAMTEGQSSSQKSLGTVVRKSEKKVGRNDPCPCGSKKKYKHCCGRNVS